MFYSRNIGLITEEEQKRICKGSVLVAGVGGMGGVAAEVLVRMGIGKIKIRGIEKDIAGTYKVEGKVLKADFPIKISDFGIGDINYMGVGVEDTVTLHVAVPVK